MAKLGDFIEKKAKFHEDVESVGIKEIINQPITILDISDEFEVNGKFGKQLTRLINFKLTGTDENLNCWIQGVVLIDMLNKITQNRVAMKALKEEGIETVLKDAGKYYIFE